MDDLGALAGMFPCKVRLGNFGDRRSRILVEGTMKVGSNEQQERSHENFLGNTATVWGQPADGGRSRGLRSVAGNDVGVYPQDACSGQARRAWRN